MLRKLLPSLLTLLFLPPMVAAADTGTISVHVSGLKNDSGAVRIALYNSEQAYSADKGTASGAFAKAVTKISGKEADYSFTDLPYGTYAVKLFHDEDNSGKFYKNFMGMPKVEFGFSNNAHGRFGPASFEQSKFDLKSPELKLTITMQHM